MKLFNTQRMSVFCVLMCSLMVFGAGCQKTGDGSVTLPKVQFVVPEEMDVEYGSGTLSFRVQFENVPSQGDMIKLGNYKPCPVINIKSTSFDVDITSLWEDNFWTGIYDVRLIRGEKASKKGQSRITVVAADDGLRPADDATVYGRILCSGIGVPDVVVSDGVEVVKSDEHGVYQLNSQKKHNYVFISVPSGYEPIGQGILPVIHQQLRKPADVAERVDFPLQEVSGQENHTMLIMGDIHLARRTNDREQFKSFVKDINAYIAGAEGRIYAMTLGDMTWDQFWEVNKYGFKDYLEDANQIKGVMVYHTIGNHDHSMYEIGDFNTVKAYKELIAPTYYSFNIGQVHYVVLDDIECTNSKATKDSNGNPCYERTYKENIVQEQLDWLVKDLAFVPTSTPLVVTMHAPLYNPDGTYSLMNKVNIENIFKAYSRVDIFTGHTHEVYNVDNLAGSHIFEHNSGAVCGTWWWSGKETPGVHIGPDGSAGGYQIVKRNGVAVSWQFKATGFPIGHQFRSYDRNNIQITADKYMPNADASHRSQLSSGVWKYASSDNEVFINVWNWDPEWRISVSEVGNASALSVESFNTYDPLHLISYSTKRLNQNADLTFPTHVNNHMFRVRGISKPDSNLEIKLTDRFGNEYTEMMVRPKAFTTDQYKK